MNKWYRFGVVVAVAVILAAGGALAGNLTPPGPPGATMYTLEDIYLAVTGDANVVNTTSGDALAGEILIGKKAWVKGQELTGTMANVGQTNMIPGTVTQMIPQGYHDGTGAVGGDADLTAGNIKKDVAIFGVTGTLLTTAVPKTGQTPTLPLNPAPAGSDGVLQTGMAWPSPRFTDNSNGTVTDNLTGLIWLKNASAIGRHSPGSALTKCATLNSGEAGLSDGSVEGDWRLPNIREMQSLVDYGRYNPALPLGHPFTGVLSDAYWSSSEYADVMVGTWFVFMQDGYVARGNKTGVYYVWPVRGGQ
jgi:hypothetical protein